MALPDNDYRVSDEGAYSYVDALRREAGAESRQDDVREMLADDDAVLEYAVYDNFGIEIEATVESDEARERVYIYGELVDADVTVEVVSDRND